MKTIAALTFGGFALSGLFLNANVHNADAENYKIDAVHSTALFRIQHVGAGNFYGRFNDVEGKFTFSETDDAANNVEVSIKADSIDTNNKQRDDHLRGPDFFNVKQFPRLTFKSSSFKKSGDKKYKITGDLTIHGVTKTIAVDVDHVGTAESERAGKRCGFEGMFTVKRSEYGINFMPGGLGEEVRIIVALEGVKE
ncbi:MAG TPA: YceI family protein [Phycisphaerae bacterium]|nr:YceI family protein [Phycisphaerae bacterium]